jgi:hypothetical protein
MASGPVLILGLAAASILIVIALVHVYWALGGQTGIAAAIPRRAAPQGGAGSDSPSVDEPVFQPGTLVTLLVACGLAAATALLLAGLAILPLPVPLWVITAGCWGLGAVFLLRAIGDFRYVGFFKKIRGSQFATLDSFLYSPLCLFLGGASATVALGAS